MASGQYQAHTSVAMSSPTNITLVLGVFVAIVAGGFVGGILGLESLTPGELLGNSWEEVRCVFFFYSFSFLNFLSVQRTLFYEFFHTIASLFL